MTLVVIESPYAADSATGRSINRSYAFMCMKDSLSRGEYPFASHLLYPAVLNDTVPDERELGMSAGFAWGEHADVVAVYVDRGVSGGMTAGIDRAMERGQQIEFRTVPGYRMAGLS